MKVFKDSLNRKIKVGDNLDIIATNMYNGTVNLIDGVMHLDTAFFNNPLADHLSAIDLQFVYIRNKRGVKEGTKRGSYSIEKKETVNINFRVPKDLKEDCKNYIRPLLKDFITAL